VDTNYIKGTGTIVGGTATDAISGINTANCEYLAAGVWVAGAWNVNHCEKTSYAIVNIAVLTFNTRVQDNATNQGTGVATGSYVGDTLAPVNGDDLAIIDLLGYTSDNTPSFTLSAGDAGSGVKEMAFSCNGVAWSAWTAYAVNYSSFNVETGEGCAAGDGAKTIYVKFRDNLDTESSSANDSTILDTGNPVISHILPIDGGTCNNQVFSFDVNDALSGIADVNVRINGVQSSDFNFAGDCLVGGTGYYCSYKETGMVVGANQLIIDTNDALGFMAETTTTVYYNPYGSGWTKLDELQHQNFVNFWGYFLGGLAILLLAFVASMFGFKGR
jgi:hypothetical protein